VRSRFSKGLQDKPPVFLDLSIIQNRSTNFGKVYIVIFGNIVFTNVPRLYIELGCEAALMS